MSGSFPYTLHPCKYFAVPIDSGAGWSPEPVPKRWRTGKFRSPVSRSFMLSGSDVNCCACAVVTKIRDPYFVRELLFVTSHRNSAARVADRLSELR